MTPPLITLSHVDVALDGQPILHDLNWRFGPGENWAVLGGNGSGKSTFLRLVRGEIWPAPGGKGERVYNFDGDAQTSAVGIKEKMVLVSPEAQERCLRLEWTRTVRDVVESGLGGGDYLFGKATSAERERVAQAVRLLGIEPLLRRNVQQLSHGELRKTLIARALAGAPRVLVCDEVCDGLDAASRKTLLEALGQIAQNGTQLIYTTHRREELIPELTHRLVLKHGHIVEQGRIADSGEAKARKPTALPKRIHSTTPTKAKTLIRIERASVFLNEKRVLHNLNWELRAGQHWAVLGPNGAGKTTLLKLILGDLHPALGGRVRRFEFTSQNTIWELRKKLGSVSPELQAHYHSTLTGAEVIASGFHASVGLMERPSAGQLRRATALAEKLGFGPLARRNTGQLSYGEFRKVLLARALVHEPELLVFDEPFDGLDAPAKAAMTVILERIAGAGTSLVLVTHHADDLPACMTHGLHLADGRIVEQGPLR